MIKINPLLVLLAITLTACNLTLSEENAATLSAQNQSYLTQAANIRETLRAQETQVLGTSIAAETAVARENAINSILLETVRAGDPPTVAVVAQMDRAAGRAASESNSEDFSDSPGGTAAETYVASNINDADGCGVDRQTQFPAGTLRVYAVQRALDIPANTLYNIEWYYNGSVALEDGLVVNTAESELCIWFFLEPYSTGDWSVQFFANGNPVGEQVNFTVGG